MVFGVMEKCHANWSFELPLPVECCTIECVVSPETTNKWGAIVTSDIGRRQWRNGN